VLLPDFGGLVADTLTASGAWGLAAGGAGDAGTSPPAGETSGAYFDAESVLGSMRQSFSHAVRHDLSSCGKTAIAECMRVQVIACTTQMAPCESQPRRLT
jgi:hypothetical protein